MPPGAKASGARAVIDRVVHGLCEIVATPTGRAERAQAHERRRPAHPGDADLVVSRGSDDAGDVRAVKGPLRVEGRCRVATGRALDEVQDVLAVAEAPERRGERADLQTHLAEEQVDRRDA